MFCCLAITAAAQTSVFTYQGRFTDSTVAQPTNGSYEMQYKLFDTAAVGTGIQIGATNLVSSVSVINGIFTVQLDFTETSFSGANVFVEIGVRPVGSPAAFTTLAPRQAVTSSPYSIRSRNAALADVSADTLKVGGTLAANIIKEGDGRLTDARTPTAGSPFYIQNQTAATLAGDFKIGGTGAANIFNAATQFNIGGNRILSGGGGNIFAGAGAGTAKHDGRRQRFCRHERRTE